jgi:translation initiation factor 1
MTVCTPSLYNKPSPIFNKRIKPMDKNNRLVYSTDQGRIKPQEPRTQRPKSDGVVRLRLDTKGRKGKGVTTISGLELTHEQLLPRAKQLTQLRATGGSVKDGVIEIQGDHRNKLKPKLEELGFKVKLAGG